MEEIIILAGRPGCGKGTFAKKVLVPAYSGETNCSLIGTGERFRQIQEREPEHKHYETIKSVMPKGLYLPDHITVDIFKEIVRADSHILGKNIVVLDGVIRTEQQFWLIKDVIESSSHHKESRFNTIWVDLSEKECRKRCLNRAEEEGRSDDTVGAIEVRLNEFERHLDPLRHVLRSHTDFHEFQANNLTKEEVYAVGMNFLSQRGLASAGTV